MIRDWLLKRSHLNVYIFLVKYFVSIFISDMSESIVGLFNALFMICSSLLSAFSTAAPFTKLWLCHLRKIRSQARIHSRLSQIFVYLISFSLICLSHCAHFQHLWINKYCRHKLYYPVYLGLFIKYYPSLLDPPCSQNFDRSPFRPFGTSFHFLQQITNRTKSQSFYMTPNLLSLLPSSSTIIGLAALLSCKPLVVFILTYESQTN